MALKRQRAPEYPDVEIHDTFPKLLAHNAASFPGQTAMREKEFGIWNAFTWADYQTRVKRIALGLRRLGVGRGDVVALIGNNRPEWVWGEVAAHALGAMSLGIYQDSIGDEVTYLLTYAEAKIVIAEDEEQVDKLLDLIGDSPSVRHVVYCDPRGMRKYRDPRLIGLEQLSRDGEEADAADPGLYAREVAAGRGDDVAILCTTSGTTSLPEAGDDAERAVPAARAGLSAPRPEVAARRLRLGAAAAVGDGAGLCRRPGADRPRHRQLRRGARDDDGRPARDRPEFSSAGAARLGEHRRRRALADDGFDLDEAADVRARNEPRRGGARSRPTLAARRCAAVSRSPRPAGVHQPRVGGDRRRRARPRDLPLLHRDGRAVAPALRPDGIGRRVYGTCARRCELRLRRDAVRHLRRAHRPSRREWRGRDRRPHHGHVLGLLQERGGDRAPSCATAGCTPATPGTSTSRTAT